MKNQEIAGIFEGPIIPVTLKIGVPLAVANLVNLLYMVADTYFISLIDKSSTALLSGTGLIFPLFFLFMAIANSLSAGLSAVTGRVIGEKNLDASRHITPSGFLIAVVICIPAGIAGYLFKEPFLRLLAGDGISEEAIGYGLQYFTILLPGLFFLVIGHVIGGVLLGEGKSGILSIAMMLSTVLNIILDPIFIFIFEMGVIGAALATTVSMITSVVVMAIWIFRGKTTTPLSFNLLNSKPRITKEITRIGLPQLVNMSTLALTFMLLNKLVGNLGEHYMNAWTLAGRIDQVLLIPGTAVSVATISMVSQNFGRANLDRVKQIFKTNSFLSVILIGLTAILYILVIPFLVPLFTSVPEVIDVAVLQVRTTAFSAIGMGIIITSVATFQATGKAYPSIILPVFRMFCVTLPLSYILVYSFSMGIMGVYIAIVFGNILSMPVAYLWTWRHLKKLIFKGIYD